MQINMRRMVRAGVMACLVLGATGSQAVQQITLTLARVRAPAGVVAEDVRLKVDISGERPAGVLRIGSLRWPGLDKPLRKLELRCPTMTLTSAHVACQQGHLQLGSAWMGISEMPIAFDYQNTNQGQRLRLTVPQLLWTFNAQDGNLAAEKLALSLRLTLAQKNDTWQFNGSLGADSGQAYVDPVFLDFGQQSAHLKFSGQADVAAARITVSQFSLKQPNVLRANGHLQWADNALASLQLNITRADLPAAFETYVQPFLIGTSFAALSTVGVLQAKLTRDRKGWTAASVNGTHLEVSDANKRLHLGGGALDVYWQRDGPLADVSVSRLSWVSAAVYKIALGSTDLRWRMAGDDAVLTGPTQVPVFDGQLQIQRAVAQGLTGDNPAVDFKARLTPVRLAKLSQAFGWPAFAGEVSGSLPGLAYRHGELVLTGGLQAKVFDGTVDLRELRITNPLSALPRLRADVHARSLDLEAMSSAFSFGRITGRLDADVTGLRMLGWRPVAFKAWLRTPKDDRSRHRISQRAIENIASLGGGASGLVSRGFLRFFDDFAYDRIGLGCALNQGVCVMRGLAPAGHNDNGDGYVIVRGRWLPRIDVVGYNRLVNWPVLLEQLKSVTAAPVVNP